MAGKGGGAWKVAYADFVTAMMAFFLVMWIVAQNKPVKQAIAKYFNDPYGTSNRPGKSKNMLPSDGSGPLQGTKGAMKIAVSKPVIETAPMEPDDSERPRVTKPTLPALHDANRSAVGMLVPFNEDSADLDERGQRVLEKLIPELQGKMSKIEVRGHASGRPLPPESGFHDAWHLSFARSVATMQYMIQAGIPARRIRLSQSGSNEPNLLGRETGLPTSNARVEVIELNELANDPAAPQKLRGKPGKLPDFKRKGGAKIPRQPADAQPSDPEPPAGNPSQEGAIDATPGE